MTSAFVNEIKSIWTLMVLVYFCGYSQASENEGEDTLSSAVISLAGEATRLKTNL